MNKTGRKIWYGIAIFLSGLVLLLSVAGIAGTWIVQNRLSNSVGRLVDNLVTVTQNIQVTLKGFDQKLASMQEITGSISQASTTLSQQVADQGLVQSLLPEEQSTKLSALSTSVQDAINNIRDTLTTVRAVYQTIDQLPLIKLPSLSQEQIDQFQQSASTIQTAVDDVTNAVAAFRAGASDQISKVTSAADQLGSRLGDVRSRLADLDTRLTNLQGNLAHLKQVFSRALILGSLLGSLFLVYIGYTQVEMIRLFIKRWKSPAVIEGTTSGETQTETNSNNSTPETGQEQLEDQTKKD